MTDEKSPFAVVKRKELRAWMDSLEECDKWARFSGLAADHPSRKRLAEAILAIDRYLEKEQS